MEIQPSPVPLSNLGTATPRADSTTHGVRSESERPVERSEQDAQTGSSSSQGGRGQTVDIEV